MGKYIRTYLYSCILTMYLKNNIYLQVLQTGKSAWKLVYDPRPEQFRNCPESQHKFCNTGLNYRHTIRQSYIIRLTNNNICIPWTPKIPLPPSFKSYVQSLLVPYFCIPNFKRINHVCRSHSNYKSE